MRGARVAMGASLGAFVLGWVALVQAQDTSKGEPTQRLWENFRREDAVLDEGQVRVELQGMTLQATQGPPGNPLVLIRGTPPGNVSQNQILTNVQTESGGVINLIGSYGLFPNTEVGGQIGGIWQNINFFNTNTPNQNTTGVIENAGTFADMYLYGKYRYPVNDNLGVGGGVELRIPTGSQSKRTGTGETGTNPFINTRYADGPWAVDSHIGYQFNSGNLEGMFNWSASGTVWASKLWGLRAEFTGWNYTYGGTKINNAYCNPGIEYDFSPNFIIRPEGQVGLSGPALGWGLGVGLAYMF